MPVLRLLPLAISPIAILLLTGCGIAPATVPAAGLLSGSVHGGQQPISGATVQLYAVGTSADGSASTPLLATPALTDSGGHFSITKYTCPSAFSLVYLTATGGNPGLNSGSSNPSLAMMTALGPCQNLTALPSVAVNELTTVAAAYALAPFAVSPFAIGSSPTDAAALQMAFTLAGQYVNISSGTAPGTGVPTGFIPPLAQLNTIADIVAPCVNSLGGIAGDGSPCGTLFNLTNPGSPTLPATDTFTALLHLALNPTLNTASLYSLVGPSAPFQPTQPTTPPDLNVYFTQPGAVLQFTPAATITFAPISVTFTAPRQIVTVENVGTVPVTFDHFAISGANASDFAQTNTCVSPVAPGTACTIQITATPAAIGPGTASLNLVSNAYATQTISLAETGTALAAGALTFSTTRLSWTVANTLLDLTLSNNGSTPINLKSVTSSDPTFKLFSSTCGTQLPANSTCTLVIESTGATLSSSTGVTIYSGTLTILTDTGPQAVALTSNSQESISPVVAFGSPAVGSSSIAVLGVQTISSSYTASFYGTIFGSNPSDFGAAGCTGSGFSTGASCQFPVTFTPTAPGPRTAKFGSPTTGYVLLTGGSAAAAAGSLTLAGPAFIAPGATGVFTVTNTGTTPVSIGAVSIGAYTFQGTQTFSQTNNCGTLLYGQSVCTVAVSASTGSFSSATLNVATGSSSTPLSAPINLFPAPVPPSFITADFGSYAVGTTSVSSNSVFGSTPNGPVTITLQGNAVDFKAAASACSYIRGACYYSVTVNFVPTTLGLRSAYFTDASGTHTFSGFGLSPGPSFSLAAQGTTYPTNNISIGGSINLGSSYTQSLNLANTGTTTLHLTQSITGPDASAFLLAPCTTLSYAANTPAATCNLAVTATPTHLGTSSAVLTVTDTPSGFSYTYTLTATATPPPATVSPSNVNFPNTAVGSISATQYVTFADYYRGTISFASSTSSAFSLIGPATCGPAPCQLGLAFNPTAAGYTAGTVTFNDTSGGTLSVGVAGTGIALPAISLSATSITFPPRPVNSVSIPTVITLTNTGGTPLTISSITLPGAVSGNFTQTNNCASAIAVNATCTINVTFAPTVAGAQSATLSIASNAANSPTTATLSGSAN